ncbi:MAG: GNAT family N-acetyltransferase [Geminicoccaceae bacterium]
MGAKPIADRRISIREAYSGDLDAIARLQARAIMVSSFDIYGQEVCEAWAKMGWQMRHGLLNGGVFFVAEREGVLVGVAGWSADSREVDCAWPRYVFVAPEAGGLGVGRQLMAAVERSAREAGRTRLQLWASLNAVGFYETLGYRKIKPARWPIGGGIEMEHTLMEKFSARAFPDQVHPPD